MTARDAIEALRLEQMKVMPRGFTPEPVICVPLEYVKIDAEHQNAYITLADLAKCFAGQDH